MLRNSVDGGSHRLSPIVVWPGEAEQQRLLWKTWIVQVDIAAGRVLLSTWNPWMLTI
jgi:hypothetical protein